MLTIPKKWLNATFFEFYGFRYAWNRTEYKGLRHLINHGVFPWLTNFKLLYHIKMKNI